MPNERTLTPHNSTIEWTQSHQNKYYHEDKKQRSHQHKDGCADTHSGQDVHCTVRSTFLCLMMVSVLDKMIWLNRLNRRLSKLEFQLTQWTFKVPYASSSSSIVPSQCGQFKSTMRWMKTTSELRVGHFNPKLMLKTQSRISTDEISGSCQTRRVRSF